MSRTAATADGPGGGGRRFRPSALSQPPPRLAVEAGVIFVLIALAAVLIYHFTVHHIHNPRPLGGVNVDVSRVDGIQSEAAVAVDQANPSLLLAASNDADREVLDVYLSRDGGRTWTRRNGPAVPGGSCAHGEPRVAIDGGGREYLAFLGSTYCGDTLTPYLLVGSRDGSTGRWRLSRVTKRAWQYGFDDGPALALDRRTGTVYVAFQRSLSRVRSTTVVSRSTDGGVTWSPPVEVSPALDRPHLASLAVAPDGTVYLAGIDAKLGVWATRSLDGGRSFAPPRRVAPLAANPSADCSLAAESPVPREATRCGGPDPTILARAGDVAVVWSDAGANGAGDVFAAVLAPDLRPHLRAQVNPPDEKGKSAQFKAAAAVDATTGTLWACWYDTTFDPNAHRAWYTCSASRDGRTWSPPNRAAAVPTPPDALLGEGFHHGLRTEIAAVRGTAHPVWIDGRDVDLVEEVYTAALSERRALGG